MQATQFVLSLYLIDFVYCQFEPFIVNGHHAKPGQFPYCAFLSMKCIDDGEPIACGSSIVNQYFTLTAAHCGYSCPPQYIAITVFVGHEIKGMGAKSIAKKVYRHEHFDIRTVQNDIGLVRLKTELEFNAKVSRVALMQKPPYKEKAIVAGWGITDDETEQSTEDLMYTKQRKRTRKTCLKLLKNVIEGTLCASSSRGQAAKGDSGSALVVRGYIQIGIVSYKMKHPTFEDKLTVYTDTGYFYNWIHKTLNNILPHPHSAI